MGSAFKIQTGPVLTSFIRKYFLRWLWAAVVVIIFINGAPVIIPRTTAGAATTAISFRAIIAPHIAVPCRASTFPSWTITVFRPISLSDQLIIARRSDTSLLWAATVRGCTMPPYFGWLRTPWSIFRNWASVSPNRRRSRSTGQNKSATQLININH